MNNSKPPHQRKLKTKEYSKYPTYKTFKSEHYYWKKITNPTIKILFITSLLLNIVTWNTHSVPWSVVFILIIRYFSKSIKTLTIQNLYNRKVKFIFYNFFYIVETIVAGSLILTSLELMINSLFPIMMGSIFLLVCYSLTQKKEAIFQDFWYLIFTLFGNLIYLTAFIHFKFGTLITISYISLIIVTLTFLLPIILNKEKMRLHLKKSFHR